MADVQVRWLDQSGNLQLRGIEGLKEDCGDAWVWVDVVGVDEAVMESLRARFGLHPLAVEDVVHEQGLPKLDSYEPVIFVVWLVPTRAEGKELCAIELDVFLGPDYLITVQEEPVAAVKSVAADAARAMRRGADWLLHGILDVAVDDVLPITDSLGDLLDELEDSMLDHPTPDDLQELYRVRRQLRALHRVVSPERDVLRQLARERDLVSEDAYRYFQDVADHLARAEDEIETDREVGAAVMDVYLSSQSNRMNEIMKQLTVVATIFMPLTLLSGIYGMNLIRGMWPPVGSVWGFAAVVFVMALIAGWMWWFFRRRHWW